LFTFGTHKQIFLPAGHGVFAFATCLNEMKARLPRKVIIQIAKEPVKT